MKKFLQNEEGKSGQDSLLPVKTPVHSFLSELGTKFGILNHLSALFLLGSSHSHTPVLTRSKIPGSEKLTLGLEEKRKHPIYMVCTGYTMLSCTIIHMTTLQSFWVVK